MSQKPVDVSCIYPLSGMIRRVLVFFMILLFCAGDLTVSKTGAQQEEGMLSPPSTDGQEAGTLHAPSENKEESIWRQEIPESSSRRHFGDALSVMHADDSGNLEKVRLAAQLGYYAVEADYNYSAGVMWCCHDAPNEVTGTLEDNVSICKENGTKIVLDLKADSEEALNALGTYIKENDLAEWVIIQTNSQYAMIRLNNAVGNTLEYWGLVMADTAVINDLIRNEESFRSLGMTAVNIPKYVGGSAYVLGTPENITGLRNAGYDICVFTWGSFSAAEVSSYSSYGVKYLMTNDLNQT